MTRPPLASWPLLLLLLIGRHGLVAGAEKSATHSEAQSVVQGSEYTKLQVYPYLEEWYLGKTASAREDTVRVDPDALNPNLSLEGLDDDDAASGRADFPCPSAAAIAPCVCTVNGAAIDLNCTEVESEEQLANVFLQEFPVKELRGFFMASNGAVEVLGNILNGLTFETVDLYPGPFALQAISEYFLLDSKETLRYLRIANSNLLSGAFPFSSLIAMEALETLAIEGSSFTWMPKINSSKIGSLEFSSGCTDVLEPGTFDDVPKLSSLALNNNSVTELRAGTVPINEGLMAFFGFNNALRIVHPGAFFFSDSNSAANNDQILIDLSYNQLQSLQAGSFPFRDGPFELLFHSNQIAAIEPGTFVLPDVPGSEGFGLLYIHFENNRLQSLRPATFPLRNGPTRLHLSSNIISIIEPGTFVLPEATDFFSLALALFDNQLTTFDEAVFGDLMPFITYLQLQANPLTCGCDIAWVVTNSAYMDKIHSATTCADGTLLTDLDPQFFMDFC